jgi:hypothetical protein
VDGEAGEPPEAVSASIDTAADGEISVESDTILSGSNPSPYDRDGCDSDYMGAYKDRKLYGAFSFWVDNEGQPGGSSYTTADTGAALERAGSVWNEETSPCNVADHSPAPRLNYAGATTWNGDFTIQDGTSTCAERDGRSVIDTGNLNTATPGTYIALNCTWADTDYVTPKVIESDIRFNVTDFDFTYTPNADSCDGNDYDVHGIMTHETGHTYGLKDKEGDINHYQTMYGIGTHCDGYQRNLGWSDLKHLRARYPE